MRGLTQMALATLVGATIGDVSNIERQYRERSSRVAKAILDLPEPL